LIDGVGVPQILERRITSLTQTDDAFESIVRLCSAGYVELANILLFYIAAAGESNVAFTPYPMSDRLRGCFCYTSQDAMIVVIEVEREKQRDYICVAIDNYRDERSYFVRPCTLSEVKTFVKETEEKSRNILL